MFDETRSLFFPTELVPGITACPEDDMSHFWDIVGPLMDEVFPAFREIGAYEMPDERWEAIKPLRDAFAYSHHEQFIFYNDRNEPVGWSYGDMRDSVSFFMTNSAILPVYRQRGIYSAFLRQFLSYLSALGYERVVSNHQTNNRAVIIAKLKMGFNVTSVNLDERWGGQVELTYLVHEDRRQGYEKAFALDRRETPISHQF
jgi:GNAT superfamily N-acetyltransferase